MTSEKQSCPVAGCGYNRSMALYDSAIARQLILETTRSNRNPDSHRDFDGFDKDEELARLHRALKEAETVSPEENPKLYLFVAEAVRNIDEHLLRLGRLPEAWNCRG